MDSRKRSNRYPLFGTTICKNVYATVNRSIDRLARTHVLGKGYHFAQRSVPPGKSPVKDNALADNDLLECVVKFRDKFYRCPWARYDLAKRGTMKLLPPDYNTAKLRSDYDHMQNMLFGEKPTFDEIMNAITQLEAEINNKIK